MFDRPFVLSGYRWALYDVSTGAVLLETEDRAALAAAIAALPALQAVGVQSYCSWGSDCITCPFSAQQVARDCASAAAAHRRAAAHRTLKVGADS